MGFDRVFDFTFAADLTIVEETTEFLNRAKAGGKFPQFTSCCPAWINFVERRYPELIEHLSTCKSPQQMMGTTVKNHFPKWARLAPDAWGAGRLRRTRTIAGGDGNPLRGPMSEDRNDMFVVSIVPCLAKKYEAARPEFAPDGVRDVDAVLTTTELLEMVDLARIDPSEVEFADFDEPYRQVSGAGMLFGATGGVAEAALRMAAEKLTGESRTTPIDFEEVRGHRGFREATVDLGDKKVRLAVIAGLKNAIPLLERMKEGKRVEYDLVEVMSCPAGCIGGAGHPVPTRPGELHARHKVLLDIDKTSEYRKSQANPDVLRLYSDFYGEANSPLAHKLLHTHFHARPGDSQAAGIRNKAESTFHTRQIEICVCDACTRKDSLRLFDAVAEKVRSAGLDPVLELKVVRLLDQHPTDDVYVTVDGRHVEPGSLDNVRGLLKA
jgi:iron-only hydrogenase group A